MLLSLLILVILDFEQLDQSGYGHGHGWTLKVQPSFQDWLLQSKIHQNSPLLFQILVQNDLCPGMRFDNFCDIMICSSDVFTNFMFWHYQSTKFMFTVDKNFCDIMICKSDVSRISCFDPTNLQNLCSQ